MGNNMNKRTAWIAAAVATVLIVAGILAVASVTGNESLQTTSNTEPAPLPSTTSPAPAPTTTASEPTQTTQVTTTTPSTTEAPSTVEPAEQVTLEQTPIWPAADVVFDTPQDAASDFVTSVLGVDPVLGEFRELDARSGEIEAQSNADAPPGTTFPRALLQLRQLRPTDGWYVISATSDGASISLPTAGAEVPAGPLTVEGEGRGFESTLNVVAFIAGPEYSDLDLVIASGGAFGLNEPYRATVDLSQASPGDVVTILVRGDTGLSEDPGEFAAVPVVIAPQTTAGTPQTDNPAVQGAIDFNLDSEPPRPPALFGYDQFSEVEDTELIADVASVLGAVDADTGWTPMPDALACTGATDYRSLLWDDVRFVLRRTADFGPTLAAWSIGDVPLLFSPSLDADIIAQSGVTTAAGIGIGTPAAELDDVGFGQILYEDNQVYGLALISPVVFALDTSDQIIAMSIEQNDC
jgi:hypothetical protein